MPKSYFHNNKSFKVNEDKKNLFLNSSVETKRITDINILLNRIKIEKKIEIKRKIIFFSLVSLGIIIFTAFLTIIN